MKYHHFSTEISFTLSNVSLRSFKVTRSLFWGVTDAKECFNYTEIRPSICRHNGEILFTPMVVKPATVGMVVMARGLASCHQVEVWACMTCANSSKYRLFENKINILCDFSFNGTVSKIDKVFCITKENVKKKKKRKSYELARGGRWIHANDGTAYSKSI